MKLNEVIKRTLYPPNGKDEVDRTVQFGTLKDGIKYIPYVLLNSRRYFINQDAKSGWAGMGSESRFSKLSDAIRHCWKYYYEGDLGMPQLMKKAIT